MFLNIGKSAHLLLLVLLQWLRHANANHLALQGERERERESFIRNFP
jgi:hypothetical protein